MLPAHTPQETAAALEENETAMRAIVRALVR
jgi:hypothetical protein